VDIGDVVLNLSARTDRPNDIAFCHRRAALNAHRVEMSQRYRVTVCGLNRHAFAANRHGSRKRDLAGHRGKDRCSNECTDVDAAMLARGVGVVPHGELLQYRAFDGPGPRRRGRHYYERQGAHDDQGSTHCLLLVVQIANDSHDTMASVVVNMDYRDMS
jgi:hypothetical protein